MSENASEMSKVMVKSRVNFFADEESVLKFLCTIEQYSTNMAMNSSGVDLDIVGEHTSISRAVITLSMEDEREIIMENFDGGTPNRIEHMTDIVGKSFGDERIFDTRAHREIYSVLLGQLKNLHDGKYRRTRGVCCSALVGAKGIGKTACFHAFTMLAKYIRPVIVLYVTCNSVRTVGSRLAESSLACIIAHELAKQSISVVEDNELSVCENVVRTLKQQNLKLLVLVDELDQLYKFDGYERPAVLATIHELAYFGDQPSGTMSVLVCSSSAFTENLITTDSNEQIRDEFPLLKSGAVNLNCTKYRTKRVHSTLPTDLKAVEAILGCAGSFEENIAYYRLVAYISGCSARNVERLLKDVDDGVEVIGSTSSEDCFTGASIPANKDMAMLRTEILKQLVIKNKAMLLSIFGAASSSSSTTIVRNLALTDWESQLEPLTFAEVERIWFAMERRKQILDPERGDLCFYVLHLTDRCWFTISGIKNGEPEFIYPFSFSTLGSEIMSSNDNESLSRLIVDSVKRFGTSAGDSLHSPQFLDRAAPIAIAAALTTTTCCSCSVS